MSSYPTLGLVTVGLRNSSQYTAPVYGTHAVSKLHFVSKNDTDVAHYNFNTDQPILVIFGRDVTDRVCYQMLICYPTCPN